MRRPHFHPARCKDCGGHRDDVGTVSQTGLCIGCGQRRLTENVAQMMLHTGPNWNKWRRSMAACVGGVLLDDVRRSA